MQCSHQSQMSASQSEPRGADPVRPEERGLSTAWGDEDRCAFGGRGNARQDGVPNRIRTGVTAVKGRCPRPLDDGDLEDSYDSRRPVGGGKRDRTADLLHAMQALSQLSYTPTANVKLYGADVGIANRCSRQSAGR